MPVCEDMDDIRIAMCDIIKSRNGHRICHIRMMVAFGVYPALGTGCWCKTEGPAGLEVPCPDLPSVMSADAGKVEPFHLPEMTLIPWYPRR